jgi:hypothetical protein
MDFGRKGDNKRAMDLMWKSGMSLKQAWKVVKGKSKPKPKSKRPTRRNCFGARDGMCPQGYEINPGTGRMRKICEFGRDPVTGKCLKGPRAFKAVPDGYEYNVQTGKYRKICEYGRDMKTGRCLPMPRVAAIREGYEINPETGRLRKACVYGRNVNGRCLGRPMDQTIPPRMGYEYAPNGKLRKICLYGRDPVSGRCMGKPRLGPVGIPEGYEVNPGTGRYRKMCLPGYYRTPRGRCVPMKQALQYEDAMEYPDSPLIGGNPFDADYLDTDPFPSRFNPFDDDPISSSSSTSACPPSNPFCPQPDDDDYDPFSVFSFGKKRRSRARPRTRRSCFGSCSSCEMYN